MTSPCPHEPHVHIRVLLGGISLDFAACHTAAMRFMREWCAVRAAADIAVIPGSASGLAGLPCERLYLEP